MRYIFFALTILTGLFLIGCNSSGTNPSGFDVGAYRNPGESQDIKDYKKELGHKGNPTPTAEYCGICHYIDKW